MILVSIALQTNLFFLHNTAWQASVKSRDRRPTYPIESRAMLAAATDHRRLKRKVAVHGTEKENVQAVVERKPHGQHSRFSGHGRQARAQADHWARDAALLRGRRYPRRRHLRARRQGGRGRR